MLALVALALVGASAAAVLAAKPLPGVINPDNRIQPSGRKLDPVGKLTQLGNLPTGGAITTDGRFAWTLSAGRGKNDIRIVRVRGKKKKVGKVVQKIPMPGVSGGIAMSPDGHAAYVSGTPEGGKKSNMVADDVPGQSGDVLHVFALKKNGKAARDGVIEVPPPSGTAPPQSFPPTYTHALSWPQDLAISPDGKTVLAALNLANAAAIVDTATRDVRYVQTGRYPYGAAITRDGKLGLISNQTDATVSVIDLASGEKVTDIAVGPHLSHPEGIAIDPKRPYAYVAVTHQDLIAVIDLEKLEVVRTLSVERPQGIGTAPVQVSVTRDGCRLLSADSGEDAIAVFALSGKRKCDPGAKKAHGGGHKRSAAKELLQRESRRAAAVAGDEAEEQGATENPLRKHGKRWALLGRVPVASYPTAALTTPDKKASKRKLVWIAAKGLGVGPNDIPPDQEISETGPATGLNDETPDGNGWHFYYLPEAVHGMSGITKFPSDAKLKRLTPRASEQIRPSNSAKPPADTPITADGPIKHVFYIVRENRTYDQILGDEPRGDGDPKLTVFGNDITPNIHALVQRFPLLDHVYANSEASIDGHFWTSAGSVSDYVVKNWHANYGDRDRPYDFGVYSVTWPAAGFLFDQAQDQGISWFNYGEAVAGTVPLNDLDRTPEENAKVAAKFAKSDLGPVTPGPQQPAPSPCFSNDAGTGVNPITMQEVYDSSRPAGANPANTESRYQCFEQRFNQQIDSDSVPAFNYMVYGNDHTEGTTPGRRTPDAMVASNDLAVGETVDLISHSPIWQSSLILVVEDDSQDGADHVDAHRIPALAISPYTKRGAVIHTRYDFLSFIRTLELATGMKALNLFDATAVPLYKAFDADPSDNSEPYDAIVPDVDLTATNPASAPGARASKRLELNFPDQVPQRVLDRILWKYRHGRHATLPPPGPNASGVDELGATPHKGNSDELIADLVKTLNLDPKIVGERYGDAEDGD